MLPHITREPSVSCSSRSSYECTTTELVLRATAAGRALATSTADRTRTGSGKLPRAAFPAADLMLCRAGAMTVAELAAVGLPGAFVPLPIGNGEQRLNAQPVVRAGGGLLVDDAELSPEWVLGHLLPVLTDPQRLWDMSRAASEFGRRDADELLVAMVYEAIAAHRRA